MKYPDIDPQNIPKKFEKFLSPWTSHKVVPEREGYYRLKFVEGDQLLLSHYWWYYKDGIWYWDNDCRSIVRDNFQWQGLTKKFK